MISTELLEWAGAAFGLAGATLLALNVSFSRYGWLCFLVSNLFLIGFAWQAGHTGLLLLQVCFSATSILGILRTFRTNDTSVTLSLQEARRGRIFAK